MNVELCSETGKWYRVIEKGVTQERQGPFDSEEAARTVKKELISNSVRKKLKGVVLDPGNDEKRIVTYVMTTGTEDRDGETVDPLGGDFREFSANPTIQENHNTDDLPIGTMAMDVAGPVPEGQSPVHPKVAAWNDYIGEGTNWPQVGGPKRMALLGNVYLSKENPKAEQMYRQIKEGTLRGGSISFVPLGPQTRGINGGNHYPRWKLLEFTLCSIGSNSDSIALKAKSLTFKRYKPEKRGNVWVVLDHFDQPITALGTFQSFGEADTAALKAEYGTLRNHSVDKSHGEVLRLAQVVADKGPALSRLEIAQFADALEGESMKECADSVRQMGGFQATKIARGILGRARLNTHYQQEVDRFLGRKSFSRKSYKVVQAGYGWHVSKGMSGSDWRDAVDELAAIAQHLPTSFSEDSAKFNMALLDFDQWSNFFARCHKLGLRTSATHITSGTGPVEVFRPKSLKVSKTYLDPDLAVARMKALEKKDDGSSPITLTIPKPRNLVEQIAKQHGVTVVSQQGNVYTLKGGDIGAFYDALRGKSIKKNWEVRNTHGPDGPGWYIVENGKPQFGPFPSKEAADTRKLEEEGAWNDLTDRHKSQDKLDVDTFETSPETLEYLEARGYRDTEMNPATDPVNYDNAGQGPQAQTEQVAEHAQTTELLDEANAAHPVPYKDQVGEDGAVPRLDSPAAEVKMGIEDKGALENWAKEEANEPEHKPNETLQEWAKEEEQESEHSNIEGKRMNSYCVKVGRKFVSKTGQLTDDPQPLHLDEAEKLKQATNGVLKRIVVKDGGMMNVIDAKPGESGKVTDEEDLSSVNTPIGDKLSTTNTPIETTNEGGQLKSKRYRVKVLGKSYLTKGGTVEDADKAEQFSLDTAVNHAKEFDGEVEEVPVGPPQAPPSVAVKEEEEVIPPPIKSKCSGCNDPNCDCKKNKSAKLKSDPMEGNAEDQQGVPIGLRTLRKHHKAMQEDLNHPDLEHGPVKNALKTCCKILKNCRHKEYDDKDSVQKYAVKVGKKWVNKTGALTDKPVPHLLSEAQEKAEELDGKVEELKTFAVKVGKRWVTKSGELTTDPEPLLEQEAQKVANEVGGEKMDFSKAVEPEDEGLEELEVKDENPPVIENRSDGHSLVDDKGDVVDGPFEDKQDAIKALKALMYRKTRRTKSVGDPEVKEELEEVKTLLDKAAKGEIDMKSLKTAAYYHAKAVDNLLTEAAKAKGIEEEDLTESEKALLKKKSLELDTAMGRFSDQVYRAAGIRLLDN